MAQFTSGLDQVQDELFRRLLETWDGGPISDQTFPLIAAKIPQPIHEVVFLRKSAGGVEVLLIPRPTTDPV